MRRDVKLGLAIGGVLILVVVVFAIINTHHTQPGANLEGGSAQATPTPGATIQPAPVPTNTAGSADSVLTSTTTQPTGGAAAANSATPSTPSGTDTATAAATDKKTDWAVVLSTGKVDANSRLVHQSPMTPDEKLDNGGTAREAGTADAGPVTTETPTPGTPAPSGNTTVVAPAPENTVGPVASVTPTQADAAHLDPTHADADTIIRTSYNVPTTAPAGQRTHVIRSGETFSSIATAAYGNPKFYIDIVKANPTINPTKLRPNTTIILPEIIQAKPTETVPTTVPSLTRAGEPVRALPAVAIDAAREYQVKAGDSLYKISEKLYGDSKHTDELYEANKATVGANPEKLKLGMVLKLTTPPTKS